MYVGSDDGKVYCLVAKGGDPGEWPMFRHNLRNTGGPMQITQIGLDDGWNLLGYGYGDVGPAYVGDARLTDGVDELAWRTAAAAGWIQDPAFYYEAGVGYMLLGLPSLARDSDMVGGCRGYWLLAYRAGLSLLIPEW